MGNGCMFNGKRSSDLGLVMESVNRQILPDNRDQYEYVLERDGALLFPDKLEDRFIEVTFSFYEPKINHMRKKARMIASWLFTREKRTLVFEDEDDVFYMAKVDNSLDLTQVMRTGSFTVIFRAEPFAYGETDEESFEIDSSPQIINVISDGTVKTPARILIVNNGENTVDGFKLEMEEVID